MSQPPSSGTDSTTSGLGHWWMQRLSAIVLVPLSLWFVVALLRRLPLGHREAADWLGGGVTPYLLLLLLAALVHHSHLGVHGIIDDYVHGKQVKPAALLASTIAHVLVAAAGLFAIVKLACDGA